MTHKRMALATVTILLLGVIAYTVVSSNQDSHLKEPQVRGDQDVSRVLVDESELNRYIETRRTYYSYIGTDVDEDTLRNNAIAYLVQKAKALEYAEDNGILVSDEQVEIRYTASFNDMGEDELLRKVGEMYGLSKVEYLDSLRYEMLRESIQRETGMSFVDWIKTQSN